MNLYPIIWDEAYLKMRSLKKKMKPETQKKFQALMLEIKAWCELPPAKTAEDLKIQRAQAEDFEKRLREILKEMEGAD